MARTCEENARRQTDKENTSMGTTGKEMEGKTQRKMDSVRQSTTKDGLTEEDTRDSDLC